MKNMAVHRESEYIWSLGRMVVHKDGRALSWLLGCISISCLRQQVFMVSWQLEFVGSWVYV